MNKNGEIVLYLLTINNAYRFFKFSINLWACLRCHFLVETSSNLFHLYRAAIQIHVVGYRKHQREIFILIFLHWLSRFIHNTNIEIRYQIYLFYNGISTFFRDVKLFKVCIFVESIGAFYWLLIDILAEDVLKILYLKCYFRK